jgi:hypothetical protein
LASTNYFQKKASWLLYLGVFFDMEVKASAIYNQISNDYNCHKHNLGLVSTPKPVAFTSYEESTSTYTVHREAYYHELAADAGENAFYTYIYIYIQ